METDLEALNIDWYLLGTCSFLDVVTSIVQEREKGCTLPSPVWDDGGGIILSQGGKDPGEIEREGCIFSF